MLLELRKRVNKLYSSPITVFIIKAESNNNNEQRKKKVYWNVSLPNDKIGVSSSEMWSFVCIRTSGLSNRDSNLESNRQWGIDCWIGLDGYSVLIIELSRSNSPGDDGPIIGASSVDGPGCRDRALETPWVYWIFFIWPYWFESSWSRFSERWDERKRHIMNPTRTFHW